MYKRQVHWAVRQETPPSFAHLRRIRTAYRRCVQWPHPTKRRSTVPSRVTSGSAWFGTVKGKHGTAQIGVGTVHWAVRQEKLPPFAHLRRIRTAYRRCVQWPHPTKRRSALAGELAIYKKWAALF